MNLTNRVSVKLTKEGLRVLNLYNAQTTIDTKGVSFFTDEFQHQDDGSHEFQLWDLMWIFGKNMNMAANKVFEKNEITILDKK